VAMKFIRIILFPLVPLYHVVTWLRNFFFDHGWLKSKAYNKPIICVGNLSTGGTGKSPMIEYLIRLLKDNYRIATLSRGYKRQTEGFVLADAEANANTIGDEPYQFHSKFPEILVAVDADRQNGIARLLNHAEQPEVILLDDAYQHRKVKSGLNILLTPYDKPYYRDFVLPTGNLREPRSGAKRADIIIVTKCPAHLGRQEKELMVSRLGPDSHQQVFFSHINYSGKVYSFKNELDILDLPKFSLVTGIANPKPLKEFLVEKGLKFDHLEYPDHHEFNSRDIEALKKKDIIVTTEKDYVRLKHIAQLKEKLYYLPITFELDRPLDFENRIKGFLAKKA